MIVFVEPQNFVTLTSVAVVFILLINNIEFLSFIYFSTKYTAINKQFIVKLNTIYPKTRKIIFNWP